MNVSKISKFISIASVVFIFFAFSSDAFAAISYTRTPTGSTPTSPITINFSFDSTDDFLSWGWEEEYDNYYFLGIDGKISGIDPSYYSACYPISTKSINWIQNANVGEAFKEVYIQFSNTNDCEGRQNNMGDFEYDNGDTLFTITAAPVSGGGVLFGNSGESLEVNQSGGSLLAAVGFVSSDTFSGIFPYLMLSVGVFVGFYVIQQIAMFWSKASGEKVKFNRKSEWTGKGVMEHDFREFKKKRRSRIKRGLE